MLRGHQMATTAPKAPVYITVDQRLQEDSFLYASDVKPNAARFQAPPSPAPDPALVTLAAELLRGAKSPVILAGRVSRSETAWTEARSKSARTPVESAKAIAVSAAANHITASRAPRRRLFDRLIGGEASAYSRSAPELR